MRLYHLSSDWSDFTPSFDDCKRMFDIWSFYRETAREYRHDNISNTPFTEGVRREVQRLRSSYKRVDYVPVDREEGNYRTIHKNLEGISLSLQDIFHLEYPLHFAHMSMDHKGMVAFTKDRRGLEQDRQTRVKIGRYLAAYYSHIWDDKQISFIANSFTQKFWGNANDLKFATTREDIRWVYENGPHSCMSYVVDEFRTGGIHPTEVYASGDISIAYMHNNKQGVYARTVVNAVENTYGRLYGNQEALKFALESRDYRQGSCGDYLLGCRLLRLESDMGLIGPFIDCCDNDIFYSTRDYDYLIIGETSDSGGLAGRPTVSHDTRGHIQCIAMRSCDHCQDDFPEDDLQRVSDHGVVCGDCLDEHFHMIDGEWYHEEDTVVTWNGDTQPEGDCTHTDFGWVRDFEVVECIVDEEGQKEDVPESHRDVTTCPLSGDYVLKHLLCEIKMSTNGGTVTGFPDPGDYVYSEYHECHIPLNDAVENEDGEYIFASELNYELEL